MTVKALSMKHLTFKAAAGLAGVLVLASVSACATGHGPPADAQAKAKPAPATPLEQYAVHVDQAPERIALGVHAAGLSPNQKAALADFFGRWRDNGAGTIRISAPLGGDLAGSRRMAEAMTAEFRRLGVPPERLSLTSYDARQAVSPPIVASFDRFEAIGPDCSRGWSNLTSTKDNGPQTHFGCAEVANIAAMAANPRDFVTPAAVEPADASRREVVVQKYRQGAVTSASADSQASGSVSQ